MYHVGVTSLSHESTNAARASRRAAAGARAHGVQRSRRRGPVGDIQAVTGESLVLSQCSSSHGTGGSGPSPKVSGRRSRSLSDRDSLAATVTLPRRCDTSDPARIRWPGRAPAGAAQGGPGQIGILWSASNLRPGGCKDHFGVPVVSVCNSGTVNCWQQCQPQPGDASDSGVYLGHLLRSLGAIGAHKPLWPNG